MKLSRHLYYSAVLLIGAAAPSLASAQPTAASAAAKATGTTAYLTEAGASDKYEIQSSELALQKSKNAGVRSFAQMMIDNHKQTTQTLVKAASSAGITPPPPQLTAQQKKMIGQLQGLSGTQFDAAYIKQQRTAHDMALTLHRTYSQKGDVPALRTAAAGAVPIVEKHREHLVNLK